MSKEHGSESAVSRGQHIHIQEDEMTEEKEAPRKISRKDFVKGAAVGAGALAGASALASCGPATTPAGTAEPCPTCPPAAECPPAATPSWIPAKWDYEADVVVVGTGFGGQGAAITAAQAGDSVIMLDKAPREHGGGNSAAKPHFGSCRIGNTKEAAVEYLTSECWGTVDDPEVILAHVEGNHELEAFVNSIEGATAVVSENTSCTYPTLPGADEWVGPKARVEGLPPQEYLDAEEADEDRSPWYNFVTDEVIPGMGIQQMWETPAIELIQDGETKEILGVKALTGITTGEDFHYTGGTEIYLKAKKAVILAIGGYENGHEFLLNFAPHSHSAHRPSGMLTWYGSPYNTGDGHYMVMKVGAKLWHMNKKEAHSFATAVGSEELHTGQTVYAFGEQIITRGPGIVVNRDGKRFYDEYHTSGHSDQTRAWDTFRHWLNDPADDIPTEPSNYADYPNVPFYWIFDSTSMSSGPLGRTGQWAARRRIWDWSEDNQTELAKGWFIQADTIEELGKQIVCKDHFGRVVGMDAAGLVETVNNYNQYSATGVDLDFGREAGTMEPIVTPPFYAMEICECQTNTQGGPKHNQYMQILDAFDEPISRLYKAGEFGSIYGFLYNGAGNVPEAMSTGRRAAQHAVTLEPWDA